MASVATTALSCRDSTPHKPSSAPYPPNRCTRGDGEAARKCLRRPRIARNPPPRFMGWRRQGLSAVIFRRAGLLALTSAAGIIGSRSQNGADIRSRKVRDHRQSRWYEEGPQKGPVGGEAISTSTSRRSINCHLRSRTRRIGAMRAHALNVAGVACARSRSGAGKGSDNLAQGGAQRSPGSASAHDTRALKGRDRRQAAPRPPRLNRWAWR